MVSGKRKAINTQNGINLFKVALVTIKHAPDRQTDLRKTVMLPLGSFPGQPGISLRRGWVGVGDATGRLVTVHGTQVGREVCSPPAGTHMLVTTGKRMQTLKPSY